MTWWLSLRGSLAMACLALLVGCATAPSGTAAPGGNGLNSAEASNPIDPWENWNRKVFAFNESVDKAVLKPIAETYRDVVPSFVRTGINNVLGNLYDVWSAANHLLQGHIHIGLDMGMRVLTNTFIGLGGLLDPATEMRLVRQPSDFGLTLGHWGLGSGPYVVLPLLGPSNLRDAAGFAVDRQSSPSTLPPTTTGRHSVTGVEMVNLRTNLLPATALLDKVALDKYSFVRDAYLAKRRDAVYDGAPPLTDDDPGADPIAAPVAPPQASSAATANSAAPAASAPVK